MKFYSNKISFIIISFVFLFTNAYSAETCSRVAFINNQEVLVDSNSSQKGEGLRYYLEKDVLATNYLNKYQENSHIGWKNAVIGSIGSGMIIGGFLSSREATRKTLLGAGVTMIIINFFATRTLERANEENLMRAIDEYNKRNLPRIYFNPDDENSPPPTGNLTSFVVSKSWEF